MDFSEPKIKFIVSVLMKISLICTIIFIVLFSIGLLLGKLLLSMLIIAIISYAYYNGFKNKKPWIIPTMLFFGATGVVAYFFTNPTNQTEFIVKYIQLAISLSQLFFFSRKNVRKFFNSRGMYLFS